MKKQTLSPFFFSLFVCALFILTIAPVKAQSSQEEIILRGDLIKPITPRIVSKARVASVAVATSPITAKLVGSGIEVLFSGLQGNMTISITDEFGNEVHREIVNSSSQYYVYIPLFDIPKGVYTIAFSNKDGVMYGEFEL